MSPPSRNDKDLEKHLKELDRLMSQGETTRRKRWNAKSRTLDWLLAAIVIALVVIALTRVAAWLAGVL